MNSNGPYGWTSNDGMTLLEKLKQDLKQAMLKKDESGRNTIRQIMSEFHKITVPITLESGKKTTRPKKAEEISNDEIIDIIRGLVKSELTVLELKKEASSDYLRILQQYLPTMASAEEITAWIRANLDIATLKSPMQAMKPVMQHFGKRADGNLVRSLLQQLTGSDN